MQSELQENEKTLLKQLVETKGSPLENLPLIELVRKLSAQSVDVKRKMEKSMQSQRENEERRAKYNHLALQCASLFFALLRLTAVNTMYGSSLQNFTRLYARTVAEVHPEGDDVTAPARLDRICA